MSHQDYDPDIGPNGWDKEAIYDSEIAPLMSQIIAICQREKIPMLASFVYRQSDETGNGETSFCTTHLYGPDQKFDETLARACREIRKKQNSFLALTITPED